MQTERVSPDSRDPVLAGFGIGITADRRWEEQAELFRRRGATVVHGPTIRTLPVGPDEELQVVTAALADNPPAVLIANTGIGIRSWFAAADSWGLGEELMRSLENTKIYARGPKASSALQLSGLDVYARATSERLDDLIDLVVADGVSGLRVAFQPGGDQSLEAIRVLEAAGARVSTVPVYRWIMPTETEPAEQLIRSVVAGELHAVTFTSAPAARNMFLIADEMEVADRLREALNGKVIAMSVGPVCSAALLELGVRDPIQPHRFRLGTMVRTLTEHLILKSKRSTICGTPIHLSGRIAIIDGQPIELSSKEALLLGILLAESPRVVSRTDLLAKVWDCESNPHVLDVTIGRLRRRLGPMAIGITAVSRRGYAVQP